MLKKIKARLMNKKGNVHFSAIIGFLILMMCLACFMAIAPVYMEKATLDSYANELIREAEIAGKVGEETTARLDRLNDIKGIYPNVVWTINGSTIGQEVITGAKTERKANLGQEISVIVVKTVTVNFFGNWTFTLTSTATGASEVYWK